MNLEHLVKLVYLNKNKFKNKKKIKKILIYEYELLALKKNKLKLGSVTFDLVQTIFSGFILNQNIEMRYLRQDTSSSDELKIENQLKKLHWKWDYSNILAFLIIFIILMFFFLSFIYSWYCNNLPEFAFKNPKYAILLNYSLKHLLILNSINSLKYLINLNLFLIDSIINFSTIFNIIF